jgi:hypothetical protein
MDRLYTREKMIDLYITAPVIRITLSSIQQPESSISDSCSYETDAKRMRLADDKDEDDIMPDETMFKEETLDSVLLREIPSLSEEINVLPSTPINKGAYGIDINVVSPYTQNILTRLSDEDAIKYISDYLRENKLAKKIQDIIDMNDPDFTYTSGSEVGILLEFWVCAHMKCPICKGELHKYALNNMPVIDVRCTNEEHTFNMGPKYFQIKASEQNASLLYFTLNSFLDYRNGFITVGSKKPGEFSHDVKPSDIFNNKIDENKKIFDNLEPIIYYNNYLDIYDIKYFLVLDNYLNNKFGWIITDINRNDNIDFSLFSGVYEGKYINFSYKNMNEFIIWKKNYEKSNKKLF